MFILRSLQDLAHARQNRALHSMFLDWSKSFDKVDTKSSPTVLRRFGAPEHVIRITEALINNPRFKVSMKGEPSEDSNQSTGIRQGCTRSPLLFSR